MEPSSVTAAANSLSLNGVPSFVVVTWHFRHKEIHTVFKIRLIQQHVLIFQRNGILDYFLGNTACRIRAQWYGAIHQLHLDDLRLP